MHLNACFVFLLLGLAAIQVNAAPKIIEKKSLAENTKLEKKADLKLEESGGEKDRPKKSATTFCVEIRPGSNHPENCACRERPAQLNMQPAPVQTLNVIQPPPQPIVQPVHTYAIVQPPAQPAQSPQTLNIIQTPQQQPQPAPEPAPEPAPTPEEQKEEYIEPAHPEPIPAPVETLNVLPVEPECNQQLMVLPSANLVLVPEVEQLAQVVQVPGVRQCPQHALLAECSCHPKNVALYRSSNSGIENLEDGSMGWYRSGMKPLMGYSSGYGSRFLPLTSSTPFAMRARPGHELYNNNMPRTKTIVNLNAAPARGYYQKYYEGYQGYQPAPNPYPVRGYEVTSGVTVNAYPQVNPGSPYYRQRLQENTNTGSYSPSEVEFVPPVSGRKIAREVDQSQLNQEGCEDAVKEKKEVEAVEDANQPTSDK